MTAAHVKNRAPHRGLVESEKDKTAHEVWFGEKPHIGHLRVFGCAASVLISPYQNTKLGPRAWVGVM